MLSNEELVKEYQYGDEQALESIVEQNMGLVYSVVNRYNIDGTPSADYEDLVQEGVIGMITACNRYEPDKGALFSSYAFMWIRQGVSRFVSQKNTNEETSLDVPIGDSDSSLTLGDTLIDDNDHIGQSMLRVELENAMDKYVPEDSTKTLKLIYGWDDGIAKSRQEVSDLLKLSPHMVKTLHNKGRGNLRQSPWGQEEVRYMKQGKDYTNIEAMLFRLDKEYKQAGKSWSSGSRRIPSTYDEIMNS